MANNLGSLVVSLGLDAAEFTKGLSKSEYQAQQWARNIDKGITFVRGSLAGLGIAAAGAFAFVNAHAEGIAAFQELGDKIGATAEEVASLKAASDLSGVSLDTMAAASIKLTSSLAKTDDEAKGVGAALGAIGLELEDFKRLGAVDQIEAVAQALAGAEDGAGKTAVAVQLFGKSGADLIPLLNDLADGAERQITLTQEQIKAADDYTKQTARLSGEIDTLVKITAADAMPALGGMVQMLQEIFQYSKQSQDGIDFLGIALGGLSRTMETLIVIGSDVTYVFKTIGDTIGAYMAVAERLIQFDLAGAKAIGAAYRENSEERRAALDRFQRTILNPVQYGADDQSAAEARRLGLTGPPKRTINFNPVGPGKPEKEAAPRPFLDYSQRITQRVAGLLEGSDVAQAKIYADTLKQLDELYFAAGISAEYYESAVAKLAGTSSSGAAATSKLAEEQKRLAELLGATESAGIDRQRQDMELLTKALEDGRIKEAEYLEAVSARLSLVADKTKEAKSFADELGLSFSSAFEDAVVGGKNFSEVLKGLGDDIVRMIVRSQVTKPLADAIGGVDWGGFLGGLFGGFRANGGPVTAGMSYVVGERGREVFTPSVSGTITPNHALGGGGQWVVKVINESGTPVRASSARMGRGEDGSQFLEIVLNAVGESLANRSGAPARGVELGYGLRPSI